MGDKVIIRDLNNEQRRYRWIVEEAASPTSVAWELMNLSAELVHESCRYAAAPRHMRAVMAAAGILFDHGHRLPDVLAALESVRPAAFADTVADRTRR